MSAHPFLETRTESMRALEMSLAYERAAGVIDSSCVVAEPAGPDEEGWFDLDTAECDLTEEIAYLESRRLLQRHATNPTWVMICDEDEPVPAPTSTAVDAYQELT